MSSSPIKAFIAPVTPLQQNCTVVWCEKTKKAAVIDPGGVYALTHPDRRPAAKTRAWIDFLAAAMLERRFELTGVA